MEKLPIRDQQIVLDLLKVMNGQMSSAMTTGDTPDEKMKTAALGLAGLWQSHENASSVEETVRDMRKGRRFDN